MVLAAVRGVIDYSQWSRYDAQRIRKSQVMLDALDREESRSLYETLHSHYLHLLQRPNIADNTANSYSERLNDVMKGLLRTYQPWMPEEEEKEKQEVLRDTTAWNSRFGDISSPETKAKAQAVADALRRMREEAPPTNDNPLGVKSKAERDKIRARGRRNGRSK
jgi:hypothetical protein